MPSNEPTTVKGALVKRNKTTIAGACCALLCALCVVAYTAQVKSSVEADRAEALARYGGEQVEVCVALRDVSPGETVDSRSVESRLWVADLLPDGAVRDLATVEGKKATAAIYEGEVLSEYRFDTAGSTLDVPEGFVAVSVPAQEVNAVGGAVAQGSRVDMYATGAAATELLAENVLVLSTSTMAQDGLSASSVAWVTLAVAPELVQEVVAAAESAQLYFSLPSQRGVQGGDAGAAGPSFEGPILGQGDAS